MKQLTCEMCGSTDLMKQDGVFVCQSCGCKYSVEEARKMMVEGTVDVRGTVQVDNSGSIENYLNIANAAYEAGNKLEAETYCNKILEIDNTAYKAWLLKGKAAGWQSTIAKLRIDEAVNCFVKAIDFAPESAVGEVKSDVASEATSLTSALITLCCNNFADFPSKDNADNVVGAALLMKRIGESLFLKCGARTADLSESLATTINNSAMNAWNNKVWPDYGGEMAHPSKYEWERLVEQGDAVIKMLETAVEICDSDDTTDTIRYSNMIAVETRICDSASYKYDSTMQWQIQYQLTSSEKSRRVLMISNWHKAWNKIDPSHVIPSSESISKSTNAAANRQASENNCVCWATVIMIIVAAVIAFLD